MKITIDIDQKDISNATQHAFAELLEALKGITGAEKESSEGNDSDTPDFPEKNDDTKPKSTSASKTSESKKKSPQKGSMKVTREKSGEVKDDDVEQESTDESVEEKEEKVDYKAIRAEIKKLGTALGQKDKDKYVPKIKALIKEYGVTNIPDLPDEKLEEFLEKLKGIE